MIIARAEAGAPARVRFAEIEQGLRKHLREFGPPRRSYHPEFPFWHLQHDGFWKVEDPGKLRAKTGGKSPSCRMLLHADAAAAIDPPLWRSLVGSPALREELAEKLLADFWPETIHSSIRSELGLPEPGSQSARLLLRRPRDPRFRQAVLTAYERNCAICGYDGRLADALLGLEAAHVRWHTYGGPDVLSNGLALCSFHHMAFDAGALSLSDDLRILVSTEISGRVQVLELLYRFVGREIRRPQLGYAAPSPAFLQWHRGQVFRGQARTAYEHGGTNSLPLAGDRR